MDSTALLAKKRWIQGRLPYSGIRFSSSINQKLNILQMKSGPNDADRPARSVCAAAVEGSHALFGTAANLLLCRNSSTFWDS
jgi:hypothetical protein